MPRTIEFVQSFQVSMCVNQAEKANLLMCIALTSQPVSRIIAALREMEEYVHNKTRFRT